MTITQETLGSDIWHRVHAQQMLARMINVNNMDNLISRSILLDSYQIPLVLQGTDGVSCNLVDPCRVTKGPCLRESRLNSWNRLRQMVLYWPKRGREWKTDISLHQDKRYTLAMENYKKLTMYHNIGSGWTAPWDSLESSSKEKATSRVG